MTLENNKDPLDSCISMSIHCLCSIGVKFTLLVDDGFSIGLAFAAGFTEALSSSWIGITSLTYLSIPFTIRFQDMVFLKQRLNLNFNTVSSVVIANFYVRDWSTSYIALDPPFDASSFLISRLRIFSAERLIFFSSW